MHRTLPGRATPVTLLAHVLPFEITDVSPDDGGDSRYVTTTIRGAQFDSQAIVKLVLPGIAEYERRIRRFARVNWRIVPASSDARRESLGLLEASKGQFRLLLDPRGTQFTSREFAAKVENWTLFSPQAVTLLVGGADGVTDEVRAEADLLWSLGRQTLAHELALLVALEQIYRAHTILAGQPYHRE